MRCANFHTVYMYAGILAIECKACHKRAALAKEDGLPIHQGNMDELISKTFRCRRCGCADVRLYIPANKDEAVMFCAGDPLPAARQVTARRPPERER